MPGCIAPPPARLYEFAGARRPGRSGRISISAAVRARNRPAACAAVGLQHDAAANPRDGLAARLARGRRRRLDKHYGYAFQWFALSALDGRSLCLVPTRPPPAPAARRADEPLSFTVHSLPSPRAADEAAGARAGRLKMLLVLAVCAAPVIASYLTYFVIRPRGPHQLRRADRADARAARARCRCPICRAAPCRPPSLQGPVAAVVVAGGACDASARTSCTCSASCARRRPRQGPRRKVWLVTDDAPPRADAAAGDRDRRRRPCCACRARRSRAGSRRRRAARWPTICTWSTRWATG